MANWTIALNNLSHGGLAPGYFNETNPNFGNKNQAGSMTDMDLLSPQSMSQGPGFANLTNGTQAAAVTTLIKGALAKPATDGISYGVGGAKLYQITSSAITNTGAWPHTIDKAAVTAEDGEDVVVYQGNLYYSYNHSGSAGDIGKFDLASTFDDDWGSTTPSGAAALQSGPHPMIVGGNDRLYIANGRYVASYDGTTFIPQALDLPTGCVVEDLTWNADRLYLTVNKSSISGSTNKIAASVFVWDGTSDSWETEIELPGEAGAIHTKSGVVYVFASHGIANDVGLFYVNGSSLVEISRSNIRPEFYQVCEYNNFLLWTGTATNRVLAYGSGFKDVPARLIRFCSAPLGFFGGIFAPFPASVVADTLYIAQWSGTTSFAVSSSSGLSTSAAWSSLLFDLNSVGEQPKVSSVLFNFYPMSSGARADVSVVDGTGATLISDSISYAKLGGQTSYRIELNGKVAESIRVTISYANGSTTNSVKFRNITIYGKAG